MRLLPRITLSLRLLIPGALFFLSILAGCNRQETSHVNLEHKVAIQQAYSATKRHSIRLGMGAMITPKEGFAYYHQLIKYVEKKIGQPVLLVDRGNYDEINKMLETGELDAAFICSGPYVEGKVKFGLELLVMPQVNNRTVYYSYIIVPSDSKAQNFDDLRNTTFAFTDPKSNSGRIVPTYMLALKNKTPESFFAKTVYTYGHDKSVMAVAQHKVDGAAVDSLIWDYMARNKPELTSRTRIIAKSEPCGIPPLVVRPGMDPGLKKKLKDAFLTADYDSEGKTILSGMMIERFVEGDDRAYDSIRAMNKWINAKKRN
jgi:phosphonate transport system substrate-binding protein